LQLLGRASYLLPLSLKRLVKWFLDNVSKTGGIEHFGFIIMGTTYIILIVLAFTFGNVAAFSFGYYQGSYEKKPLTKKAILLLIINLIINRKDETTKSKGSRAASKKNTPKSAKNVKRKVHRGRMATGKQAFLGFLRR